MNLVIIMLDEVIRMKQAVKNASLSYMDLERLTGVSHSTLQRYLTGKTNRIPLSAVEKIAKATGVSAAWIMGWEEETKDKPAPISDEKIKSVFNVLDSKYLRQIPVFESVSAGFGAYASNTVLEYIPLYIRCDYEAENTLCLKVVGDSMYPKIEDGDTIQVLKQDSVDSGQVAVVLIDGEEGLVKKVVYGSDWIELHSFNPTYKTMRFVGAEVQRIKIVGLVKTVIKRFD